MKRAIEEDFPIVEINRLRREPLTKAGPLRRQKPCSPIMW